MNVMKLALRFLTLAVLLFSSQAWAELRVDITQGRVEPMPLAVVEFTGDNSDAAQIGRQIAQVVTADLERSGLFRADTGNWQSWDPIAWCGTPAIHETSGVATKRQHCLSSPVRLRLHRVTPRARHRRNPWPGCVLWSGLREPWEPRNAVRLLPVFDSPSGIVLRRCSPPPGATGVWPL